MELKLKDMYSYLLSHTFPGLFFGIEIMFIFKWFMNVDLISPIIIEFTKPDNAGIVIAVVVLSYAFSTLLGFVLDGIHHFVYEDFMRKFDGYKDDDIFAAINTIERMQIYQHFVEDDYWYPYEAYANISIAMLPGLFLLTYKLINLGITWWIICLFTIVYILILYIMFYEAKCTYECCCDREEQIIKNFSNDKKE